MGSYCPWFGYSVPGWNLQLPTILFIVSSYCPWFRQSSVARSLVLTHSFHNELLPLVWIQFSWVESLFTSHSFHNSLAPMPVVFSVFAKHSFDVFESFEILNFDCLASEVHIMGSHWALEISFWSLKQNVDSWNSILMLKTLFVLLKLCFCSWNSIKTLEGGFESWSSILTLKAVFWLLN